MTEGIDVAHAALPVVKLLTANSRAGTVIYKDLRGFIKQVDELGALRRVNGADPKFELGGITEVAAGTPECPALLFDRIKGYAPGFRVFTNATTTPQRAALALGIDPSLKPLDALKAWMQKRQTLKPHPPVEVGQGAVHGKLHARAERRPDETAGALLAPQGRRAVHRLGLDRHHARSGRRLDQRLDLPRPGARQEQGDDPVRPSRPPRRDHRQEILGQGQVLSGRRGQRRGPGAVHRRLRISARRPVGIRLRRRDQGRAAARCMHGPLTGLPLPAQAEIILEGELLPPSQDHAAGGPVRRVHRLLRRRRAALPGDAGERDPSSRRSDPARLAADEAAALSFRPAVPRRLDLEQSGNGRRHRRGRRLAACRAADDGGGDPSSATPATPSARR